MISDNELRLIYGNDAVFSRKASFVLVHLDRPSQALVASRTEEFDPASYFCDQCPICQMLKDSGILIFSDALFDEDDGGGDGGDGVDD